jgi:hypothetical protein
MRTVQAVVLALLITACTPGVTQSELPAQTKNSLDFWLGEWTVVTDSGALQGTNLIEKELNGAAVFEHWTSKGGGEGKSLFYWMPDKKKWKQVWVTPTSYKEKIAEPVKDGLLFTGTAFSPNGTKTPDRTWLTKQNDGTVRQKIEVSRDGGRTWAVTFNAIYKPKS